MRRWCILTADGSLSYFEDKRPETCKGVVFVRGARVEAAHTELGHAASARDGATAADFLPARFRVTLTPQVRRLA